MFWNERKIRRWDARPRYCTATCCTPGALPHHNKLWFIKYYDFSKKYSPGCAFPPQAARRRHNRLKYNTKTTYHVWNDDFWQRYCVMRRGKSSGAYVGSDRLRLSAGTLAQQFPIHSQGCAVGQPHFFQLFISVANRVSFSYDKGLLCLDVFTHSPVSGGEAGAAQIAAGYNGEDYFSWPCCCSSSSLCICRACSCQACLRSLRYCLSVCLAG